jgi:hypothetical protein
VIAQKFNQKNIREKIIDLNEKKLISPLPRLSRNGWLEQNLLGVCRFFYEQKKSNKKSLIDQN